jgi:cytochrome oxidase Cu insertion factor (SCO1/SenC/PrrC family)
MALGLALGILFAVSVAAAERVAPTAAGVRPLEVGATLPDVTLRNPDGEPVALREVTGNGPVVLVFYRGGW